MLHIRHENDHVPPHWHAQCHECDVRLSPENLVQLLAQQITWVYILLGDAITEMLLAFGMILLLKVTFNFEAEAMIFIHQENQQKFNHLVDEEEDGEEEEEVDMQ